MIIIKQILIIIHKMYVINNSSQFRVNVSKKISSLLDNQEKMATNIEKGIFNYCIKQAEEKRSLRRGEYIDLYGYEAWLGYIKKHDIPENSKWADAHKN